MCLCKFTHNLAQSFEITCKKTIFTGLGKYELRQFNSGAYSELCETFKMNRFAFCFQPLTVLAKRSIFNA